MTIVIRLEKHLEYHGCRTLRFKLEYKPFNVSVNSSRKTSNCVHLDFDSGIGCVAIHPPQAYWKKSWHGSAVRSIDSIKLAALNFKRFKYHFNKLQIIKNKYIF
jgi:hypothetical protein